MKTLVLLVGKAGAGKDSVASALLRAGEHRECPGVAIALADPLKRFAKHALGFTDDQLWGPSEARNAVDPRSIAQFSDTWKAAMAAGGYIERWVKNVAPGALDGKYSLVTWADCYLWNQDRLSPRYVLQHLGTEWGRNLDKNLWVSYAAKTADKILGSGSGYAENGDPGSIAAGRRASFVLITDGRFPNEVFSAKKQGGLVIQVTGRTSLDSQVAQHASESEQDSIPKTWIDVTLENNQEAGLGALDKVAEFVFEREIVGDRRTYRTVRSS